MFRISKEAETVLSLLEENGFEAYLVGGCVRDFILGRLCNDYDITTSALPKEIKSVFKKYKIDTVIHFAAFIAVGESVENPAKYYRNNVIGTINLLDVMLANNIKNIIFSSTVAIFGNPEYTPIDEVHKTSPINPYGWTKLMIEKIFADYRTAYGLNYIDLRYSNASGCSSDCTIGESHNPETHLIPLVLKAIKGERENIKIFGTDYDTPNGTCIRDYIHVEDLANAHHLAIKNIEKFSGAINLGTSKGTSVKEIIEIAEKITGKSCPIVFESRRAGDPSILCADNKKAGEILGWHPTKTMEDIISSAWNWELNKKF